LNGSLLQNSAIPLLSSVVLFVAVILKLLGFDGAIVGTFGFAAMIVLLVSSFKPIFLRIEDIDERN
jgi:hypothetical protein